MYTSDDFLYLVVLKGGQTSHAFLLAKDVDVSNDLLSFTLPKTE